MTSNKSDSESRFKFKIENCVGSANLGRTLDLQELYKQLLRLQSEIQEEHDRSGRMIDEEWPFIVRHQPKEFPGLILKLRLDVRASLLIFSSGNIVITGAKNKEELDKVANTLVDLLRRAGVEIDERPEIKLQNIVASADLGKPINLELVAMLGRENVHYEPEIFPGAVYRLQNPRVVMLLFRSGRIVCTGAKSEEMVLEALEVIDKMLSDMGAYVE